MLCPACTGTLPAIEDPYCQRCGTPVPDSQHCVSCALHPPDIDGIRSVFVFDGLVRKAIHELKYGRIKALAEPMAQLMADFASTNRIPAGRVVPVPLHPKRLRSRGYNQSTLLGRAMAKKTSLTMDENVLVRTRDTVSQARTGSAAERRLNVQGAFICPVPLQGDAILIVDDVCTTGATMEACAAALKCAGAGPVWGLTMARETLGAQAVSALENGTAASIK